jgi:uncharacterized membrane protein
MYKVLLSCAALMLLTIIYRSKSSCALTDLKIVTRHVTISYVRGSFVGTVITSPSHFMSFDGLVCIERKKTCYVQYFLSTSVHFRPLLIVKSLQIWSEVKKKATNTVAEPYRSTKGSFIHVIEELCRDCWLQRTKSLRPY